MKLAFLYAGQGSQHIGMGTDLYQTYPLYQSSVDVLPMNKDFKKIMDKGPEEVLQKTEYTQPCMAIFAIGVTEALRGAGIFPDAACGLSIGEYGALYAAGIMNANDYLEIVAYRGKVMEEASKGITCSMSAVIGLEADVVERAVQENEAAGFVVVANYNCPGQYVICGEEQAVTMCEESCKKYGAKQCIRLKVGGPFHTKYMSLAGKKLREKLEMIEFKETKIPILLNTTGSYYTTENLKDVLEKQVQESVHFESELLQLLEDGYDTYIEIGPGKTLTGFVKRTAKKMKKNVKTYAIDTVKDLQEVVEALGKETV